MAQVFEPLSEVAVARKNDSRGLPLAASVLCRLPQVILPPRRYRETPPLRWRAAKNIF
jgi:hypothetical protein